MSENLEEFLSPELTRLIADGERLLASAGGGFYDYSFVVFPFAKAYEGFLKKLFFQIGAISKEELQNDRWRVGRALNPQLEKELRHTESVYDRLCNYCVSQGNSRESGEQLAQLLWQAWKKGRNQIFHYYPHRFSPVTFAQAQEAINLMIKAMESALTQCKLTNHHRKVTLIQ